MKYMLMHRLIMGNPKGMQVDHVNEEQTLDNRRSNLRVATHGQNQMNTGKHAHNTSGYKWVSWSKSRSKYRVRIVANKVEYHIGYFDDPKEGYEAALERVASLHQEFAHH